MQILAKFFKELQADLGIDFLSQVGSPPAEQAADLAFPCFALAKEQKRDPQLVAEELVEALVGRPQLSRVRAVGGYLNISFKSEFLAKQLADYRPNFKQESPRPVVIDFCGVNLAKPLSVGHLRNIALGQAIKNIYQYFGQTVITDNHLGDSGTIFGLWAVGLQKYSSLKKLETDGLSELNRIYLTIIKAVKVESDQGLSQEPNSLSRQVQDWLLKLQAGDKNAWRYHQLFKDISLKKAQEILNLFKIKFDYSLGESFYQDQARQRIKELQETGLGQKQPDGSVVVDLTSAGIKTPLLIQKSNGAHLYSSADIATLFYRQKEFNPAEVIYVVGSEQNFYFKQLAAFNQKAGYLKGRFYHCSYGLIEEKTTTGGRQKMSSRRGGATIEELLVRARETVAKTVKTELSPADQEKIVVGGLLFLQFNQGRTNNILFDWQTAFSLQGRSGPYVQYAGVRLKSILKMVEKIPESPVFGDYSWEDEHQLLWLLLSWPETIEAARQQLEPAKIASYAYRLAKCLNRYYEKTRVLNQAGDVSTNRLWLLQRAQEGLKLSLELLGIDIPEAM